MAMDEGTKLLLAHMQENNALTKELLKEKKKDDTPTERIADQLPEIAADKYFLSQQIESDKDISKRDESDSFLQIIAITLSDQYKVSTRFYAEMFYYLGQITKESNAFQVNSLSKTKEGQIVAMSALGEYFLATMKPIRKNTKMMIEKISNKVGKPLEDLLKSDKEKSKNDLTPSQKKEEKKEEQTRLGSMFRKLGGAFSGVGKFLGDKIKNLSKSLLGKTGLVTLVVLAILALTSVSKKLSETVVGLALSFGSLFKNLFNMDFSSVGGFFGSLGTFLAEGFTALGVMLAYYFKTKIIGKLFGGIKAAFLKVLAFFNRNELGKAMKALGKVLLRFVAWPIGIILGVLDFINAFNKEMFEGSGSFLKSLGAGLTALIMGFVDPIVALIQFIGKVLSLPMILLGNMVKELYRFLSSPLSYDFDGIGGRLTQGMPFFDSGASPSTPNLSASAMGPTGGNTYVISTNNIDASSNAQNHSHTNTNITDSQADNTGL